MKKIIIAIIVCVLLLCSSVSANLIYLRKHIRNGEAQKNQIDADHTLNIATELIENATEEEKNNDTKDETKDGTDLVLKDDILGILKIPKLNINAPIKDGTSQEIMRTSVGHFIESDYWDGNVSFASHNGGTNAHYFEKINKLNTNDEIEYITKLGTKKYKVQNIQKIKSTDWSMVKKNSNNGNTITLITCISGHPKYRLCVRGVEI